jgi:hypothetical protein
MTVEGMAVLLPQGNVEQGAQLHDPQFPDWLAIRVDYDAGLPYAEIQAKHGVTYSALSWRIKSELWPTRRRRRVIDRPMIITRMFRVLERQVADLEMEMSDMARNGRRSGDKEVALLGKLAGNLGKLMDYDTQAGEGRRTKARTRQMTEVHHKLIERIEQLKRG